MPRYFFDTDDGTHRAQSESIELTDLEAVRTAVLASLPDMARDTIPNGDHRVLKATASDESGRTIYTATLTLDGHWG